MTTSRYPSSADLAAFRATFPLAPYIVHPTALPPYSDPRGRPASGAWSDERANGIGHRATGRECSAVRCSASVARREAAAMRSRAFARSTTHPGRLGAFLTERTDGCPDRPTLHHFR